MNFTIPESEHEKTILRQFCISLVIGLLLLRRCVLASVQFHDDFLLKASKINNVILQRHLPSKFKTKLPSP